LSALWPKAVPRHRTPRRAFYLAVLAGSDFFLLLSRPLQQLAAVPKKRSHKFTSLCVAQVRTCQVKRDRVSRIELDQHFSRLLTFLCPEDPDEAGRLYLRLHQKLVGFFQFSGVADPAAAADEALDRAGRRIAEGTDVPDINKFCLGIARFIIKEGWRVNTRESNAFVQFLEQHERDDDQSDRFSLMKNCLEQLPQPDRELLHLYCAAPSGRARARHRREVADQLNFTVTAIRVRVTRLRRSLEECVKKLSQSRW